MTAIKAKRPLRSLLQAKNNFVSSIRVGIDELMTRAGYSRQRATDTLLRELGRGGEIPTDQEVRLSFRIVPVKYVLWLFRSSCFYQTVVIIERDGGMVGHVYACPVRYGDQK